MAGFASTDCEAPRERAPRLPAPLTLVRRRQLVHERGQLAREAQRLGVAWRRARRMASRPSR